MVDELFLLAVPGSDYFRPRICLASSAVEAVRPKDPSLLLVKHPWPWQDFRAEASNVRFGDDLEGIFPEDCCL